MEQKNVYSDDDAISKLDEIDKEEGVNKFEETKVEKQQPQEVTSLGKASTYINAGMSEAEDSPWKILNLELLPSRGMFYPDGSELVLRSATTREIRHWSTMDESDPIDVREKMNYVLNKCTKFKIKGRPVGFSFNDFNEIDKYHIIFRIYELTFPNQENKLNAKIRHNVAKCGHVNKIQVTSQNLIGFEIPEELIKWYSPEDRCFVVKSEKLGETLKFYMPTSGMQNVLRQKRKQELEAGVEIDEAFYSFAPYLLTDWRRTSIEALSEFKINSIGWSERKFTIIHKFTEALKKNSVNRATGTCEKCKSQVESSIFLRGSFTTKDIFIVSTRLDELI